MLKVIVICAIIGLAFGDPVRREDKKNPLQERKEIIKDLIENKKEIKENFQERKELKTKFGENVKDIKEDFKERK
jgi:hypothetical protein